MYYKYSKLRMSFACSTSSARIWTKQYNKLERQLTIRLNEVHLGDYNKYRLTKNIRPPQGYPKMASSTISKPECVSVIPPLPERRTDESESPNSVWATGRQVWVTAGHLDTPAGKQEKQEKGKTNICKSIIWSYYNGFLCPSSLNLL